MTHKDKLTPEYLLLNEIKQATVRLGGKLERRWVESHQKMFTLEAIMNNKAEELANTQKIRQGIYKSSRGVQCLPHQEVQILFHRDTYDWELGVKLRRHIHGYEAEEYIAEKLNIKNVQ